MAEIPADISAAIALFDAGELTAADLTARYLDRIEAENVRLGAYVSVSVAAARESAAALDRERASGVVRGPLHGIPIAVKDVIATADAPTYGNSRVTDDGWAPGIDATAVRRLRAAGCVVLGKTTTNEFASGANDPSKGFPTPVNPWDAGRTPAGSSSGSGIAIAAELALAALGTDTGGSIRAPSAAVGVTGLKPTYGRVPRSGVIPLGFRQDVVGPMAHSALDCAYLLKAMAGPDGQDRSCSDRPVPAYAADLTGDIAGLRVGVPYPYFYDAQGLDEGYREAALDVVALLQEHGASVIPTEVPLAREASEANTLLWVCDGFSYHRDNLISRWSDFGRSTRTLLAQAAFYTAADYLQAQRVQARFRAETAELFRSVDVLVVPGTLSVAERFEDMKLERRRLGPNFRALWDFGGNPAAVAPCGFDEHGLPYSFQVIGPMFGESTVLRVVDAYQRQTDHHRRTASRAEPGYANASAGEADGI